MKRSTTFFLFSVVALFWWMFTGSGCAQIGFPTGGEKDTIPPVLVSAAPPSQSIGFTGKKIVFTFNEYVDLQDLQKNIFISPPLKNNPVVSSYLTHVNINFRDSLAPNTTYIISLGNAIRDINENNVFSNFNYVFSTGDHIDSLNFNGKVTLAETGLADSTMIALLYRNLDDSAVQHFVPDYMARISGDGSFNFHNLPAGTFKLYALQDADGGRTYNSKKETFAFFDSVIVINGKNNPVELFAFAQEKISSIVPSLRSNSEKKLRISNSLISAYQSLIDPLLVSFNNPLETFDSTQLKLTDTNFVKIPAVIQLDSTRKKLSITSNWKAGAFYYFIIPNEAVADSSGSTIATSDSIRFQVKTETAYGRILLRFTDKGENKVLQMLQGNDIKFSFPITGTTLKNNLIPPGEYTLRILFDNNNNGKWDTGNYLLKKQPEQAITIPQKLSVRADWDNERDISF